MRIPGRWGTGARPSVVVVGFAILAATAAADFVTRPDLSLLLFCVVAVALVAWHGTPPLAMVAVAGCAAQSLITELAASDRHPGIAAWNAGARFVFLSGGVWLLFALRTALTRAESQARRDDLTGVLNRFAFEEQAEVELARSRRDGSGVSAAYFDLDGLKRVNDTLGHEAGDATLVRFSEHVRRSIRPTDVFARMGGDEFALLLPDTSEAEAIGVVNRILDGGSGAPPASIGLGVWTRPPVSVESLLRETDALMYEAKQRGGRRFSHRVVG